MADHTVLRDRLRSAEDGDWAEYRGIPTTKKELRSLLSDLDTALVECERLRADAERYRWLRDNSGRLRVMVVLNGGHPETPKTLDAAIDAFRQEARHG